MGSLVNGILYSILFSKESEEEARKRIREEELRNKVW